MLTHLSPTTLAEALEARAAHPGAVVVAGGTGVMVDRNRDGADAPLLDLSGVAGLRDCDRDGDTLRLGAGVTYTQVIEQLGDELPDLAAAAQTVASRQIRNRATIAGALVIGDPSADALAVLGAAGADVEIDGPGGRRAVPAVAFVRGLGDVDLGADELVVALRVPRPRGPSAYAKVGARNAMARAVCGVAVRLDVARESVSVCIAGCGPQAVAATLAWDTDGAVDVPGVEDSRAGAAYRRHAARVLAARALARARQELAAWT